MIPAHLVEQLSTALARWGWPLRQPTDARVDARARSDDAKARQLREKGNTATDIAKILGVSRATVYRHLADDAVA